MRLTEQIRVEAIVDWCDGSGFGWQQRHDRRLSKCEVVDEVVPLVVAAISAAVVDANHAAIAECPSLVFVAVVEARSLQGRVSVRVDLQPGTDRTLRGRFTRMELTVIRVEVRLDRRRSVAHD